MELFIVIETITVRRANNRNSNSDDPFMFPALKASPQFLEQKQRLERAKMGDFLKNKMQQRPDRDTLIRAHILEDTSSKLDPSLQEKQRRLKRARLKDDLNDRLAHRPGPLELIRGNILQADESFAQALKGQSATFRFEDHRITLSLFLRGNPKEIRYSPLG